MEAINLGGSVTLLGGGCRPWWRRSAPRGWRHSSAAVLVGNGALRWWRQSLLAAQAALVGTSWGWTVAVSLAWRFLEGEGKVMAQGSENLGAALFDY